MQDQKSENLLNLALDTAESEREQTKELNVGYDPLDRTWEIIVKYAGELREVLQSRFPAVRMRGLLNGFAILTVPEEQVDEVISLSEIQYAEKPKRLFFNVNQAKSASCLTQVQSGTEGLSGRGVLVAVIDSGAGVIRMPAAGNVLCRGKNQAFYRRNFLIFREKIPIYIMKSRLAILSISGRTGIPNIRYSLPERR